MLNAERRKRQWVGTGCALHGLASFTNSVLVRFYNPTGVRVRPSPKGVPQASPFGT